MPELFEVTNTTLLSSLHGRKARINLGYTETGKYAKDVEGYIYLEGSDAGYYNVYFLHDHDGFEGGRPAKGAWGWEAEYGCEYSWCLAVGVQSSLELIDYANNGGERGDYSADWNNLRASNSPESKYKVDCNVTSNCENKEVHRMYSAEYKVEALIADCDEAIEKHESAIAAALEECNKVIDDLTAKFKKTGQTQFSEEPVLTLDNDAGRLTADLKRAKHSLERLASESISFDKLGVNVFALCENAGQLSTSKKTLTVGVSR